ncbi:MAG: O-antigen ligase family protein [Acidobacteria bacterium]|nr:O-antigen ligase family protein [Acidobacteriota bacterium]
MTISAPWRWCRTVFEAGLLLAAIGMIWSNRDQPRRLLNTPLLLVGPAVAGLAQMALGTMASPLDTAKAVLAWAVCFAAAYTARHALAHTPLRHRFLSAAAAGFAGAAVCLLQIPLRGVTLAGFTVPDFDMFAGPFANRNTYASVAELLLPIVIWKAVSARQGAWFWWAAATLIPASVIATGSRAGSFLILCEFGALLLMRIRARMLFPLTGAAVVVMATGWDTLADRLGHEDWSSHRRQVYASSVAMVAERPWAGHGLGTYPQAYPRFATFDSGREMNHAHNDWLEWAADGGLGLPLLLAGFLGLTAWFARRHFWSWGIAFAVAHSAVDYPLQLLAFSYWFWAVAGAVFAAATSDKRDPRRRSSRSSKRPLAASGPSAPPALESTESSDRSLTTAGH